MRTRIYIVCNSNHNPRAATVDPEEALRFLAKGTANGMIRIILEVWEGGYRVGTHFDAGLGLTLDDLLD